MAVSPAVSPAAGMPSPASARSASPSATAALSTPPPVAASPAAHVDFERAPSAALVADPADPAGDASDGDSSPNQDSARVWDYLERNSRYPSLDSPGSVSSSPASPSVSPAPPASPAPREDVAVVSAGGLSPPSRLQEMIYRVEVEGEGADDVVPDEDDTVTTAAPDASSDHGSGLFDESGDEEELPRAQRSRLRRGDETSTWHPMPLPPVPKKHPSNNRKNHYDPIVPWDYDTVVDIVRLLDVEGKAPHRCYLVEWEVTPLQLSWVWMEQLDKPSTRYMMGLVDDWKASGDPRTFCGWFGERDTASEAGTCFMDAFRSALYYLGQPDLVTMEMWDAYEDTRPEAIQYGVSRDDVTEFFKLLQRNSVPLNYDVLLRNALPASSANIVTLQDVCRKQAPGVYIVSAGRNDDGHCFVVINRGPEKLLLALDSFNACKDPPVDVLPLSNQMWIQHVKWMAQVELQPGYKCRHGKRKLKTQKKREKRMKQQAHQQEGM
ncbi:hypothetical protein PR001_g18031 [Phytophthora rubi]|uniref:Uncharacterized protein n=1 Tax=Phytophthora rubi TaxID=129364 RepID=A0A6A3K6K5_9STRA|nr:hypothetical protein PR002_g20512 [Phytophthora rubi]KAE9003250.1 hypothetical protein PR001_g18031 [Phytophthora rubi]